MKISLGCDHGGYALKEHIKAYLESKGHEVVDCGTYSTDSCDYPIFGEAAARIPGPPVMTKRPFRTASFTACT